MNNKTLLEKLMDRLKNELNKLEKNEYFTEYDGYDDPRIFVSTFGVETKDLSKEDYEKYEKALNDVEIKKCKYEVYFWNDSSGYDYWNVQQEEDNYIQQSIWIKNPNLTKKEIKQLHNDIWDAINQLDNKLEISLHYSF